MDTELITVAQLPIIQEKLWSIKRSIESQVEKALALNCTEDTYKEVKKARADLTKQFGDLENRRKAVKEAIMAPYNEFEAVYRDCVTDVYKPADLALKAKISSVEDVLKATKQAEVEAWFEEYKAARGIDFIDFERSGIPVTMSVTVSNLKKLAKAFIDGVASDVALIEGMDGAEEIMVEYKQTLDASRAISAYQIRRKAIEEERARAEAWKRVEEQRAAAAAKVEEALAPPVSAPAEKPAEKRYQASFRVTGTYEQIVELKKFLDKGDYEYDKLA